MRSTPWKVKSQLPEFYQTKTNIGSMTQSKARYIKTMAATSYKQLYYANPAKKHNNDTLPPPHSQTESTYTSIFYNKKLTVLKLQNFGQPNTNCTASNKLLLPLPFRPTTQFISELNGWISGCCLNERKFERVIDLMCMVDVVCFIYISYIIVLLQGWFCTTIGRGKWCYKTRWFMFRRRKWRGTMWHVMCGFVFYGYECSGWRSELYFQGWHG